MRSFLSYSLLITLISLISGLGQTTKAQSPEDFTGNWIMYFGTHKLSERLSVHTEAQLRLYEPSQNFNQLLTRTGLNYHFKNGNAITMGYGYIPAEDFDKSKANSNSTEHRVWQQLILKNSLSRLNFEHRYRVEQRWVTRNDQTNYSDRLRYRLLVSIPINHQKMDDKTLFLAFYDEIFINVSDQPFDQNRLYGALGYKRNGNLSFQAGYLRHRLGSSNLNRIQFGVFITTGKG